MRRSTRFVKPASILIVIAILSVAIWPSLSIADGSTTPTALVTTGNNALSPQGTTGGNPKRKTTTKSQGQKPQTGQAGGTDTNIKTARGANAKNAAVPAPEAKGGPKSRATVCRIHVDNRTPFVIDIYADGEFRGTAAPWDDLYGWVETGARLYARADFDDGTYLYWNGVVNSCPKTWTLIR